MRQSSRGEHSTRDEHSQKTQYEAWCCGTHISDKNLCTMKYIRDDALKVAFATMINKLIFAQTQILKPYVDYLRSGAGRSSNHPSFQRIQEIETLLFENAEQRENLTKLMTQGYIDPIFYTQENNVLLQMADEYRTEINLLNKSIYSETTEYQAAVELIRFVGKKEMLDHFDEVLFEQTVERIVVESRNEVVFELKCGLALREKLSC